ncbi:hypothetical protein CAPTEDRAFT_153768 [Capitella teleta]|uniref:Peptidase A1 domain-containing protein n=1 Tax=Capitella teleta TaxID=283909 RepID=R7U6L4_CAPTE|nr:hypothetical protein CAPTEDRAFT_153768 [Capitella teleta]|eukprot:ELU01781.1 hypothetical protein CAPTEDRAFT_153768 [Capitella teleta]
MGIGTPPQQMNILIDTGSSNFALAAADNQAIDKYFDSSNSSTFSATQKQVSVPYTQGNWQGYLATDVVTIPSMNITVDDATLSCIYSSENFFINGSNWQGILGLGYSQIARPDSSVEPLFDAIVRNGIVNDTFSMQLCGNKFNGTAQGVLVGGTSLSQFLVLGGISESLYEGPIYYAPIHEPWYYEVVLTDIKVGRESLNMDCKEYNYDKTIVDSGTTNLRVPKRVFQEIIERMRMIMEALPIGGIPATFWDGSEKNILCPDDGTLPWETLPSIELHLGMTPNSSFGLVVAPRMYLRPVHDIFDPLSNGTCYKFAITPSDTGTVIGAVVMEAFYVIFDRVSQQVGFASSSCGLSVEALNHLINPYTNPGGDNWDCAYLRYHGAPNALQTVAYVMAGVCGACLIPLVVMVIHWQIVRCKEHKSDDYGLLHEDHTLEQSTE